MPTLALVSPSLPSPRLPNIPHSRQSQANRIPQAEREHRSKRSDGTLPNLSNSQRSPISLAKPHRVLASSDKTRQVRTRHKEMQNIPSAKRAQTARKTQAAEAFSSDSIARLPELIRQRTISSRTPGSPLLLQKIYSPEGGAYDGGICVVSNGIGSSCPRHAGTSNWRVQYPKARVVMARINTVTTSPT